MLDDTRASDEAQTDSGRQAVAVGILAKAVTYANTLVTLFLIVGMIVDQRSVTVSVLSGAFYFFASTGFVVTVLSGALPAIIINGQNQKTLLKRDELPYKYNPTWKVVEPLQIPATLPTEGLQTPIALPTTRNFVPAQTEADDGARREAVAFILQLYNKEGNPDPAKVLMATDNEKPGRLRIKAPSRPAKEYLLRKHILLDLGTGYRLNLARCRTIEDARRELQQPPL